MPNGCKSGFKLQKGKCVPQKGRVATLQRTTTFSNSQLGGLSLIVFGVTLITFFLKEGCGFLKLLNPLNLPTCSAIAGANISIGIVSIVLMIVGAWFLLNKPLKGILGLVT